MSKSLVRPATSWSKETFLTVTFESPAMLASSAAMQYSYPSLIDSGVVPFHQPGAGSVVSTVSVPLTAGVILIELGLLVMSQFPIFVAPPAPVAVDDDESEEPHAAKVAVMATALISPMVRLRSMRGVLPTGKPAMAWVAGSSSPPPESRTLGPDSVPIRHRR